MKTPLQIIIALCILPLCLNAQRWFPKNATWTFNRGIRSPFPYTNIEGYTKYSVVKDTIVNNTTAKLINVSTVDYNGVESVINSLFMYESDSRVYLWNGSEFRLMYDFSLNVGDTLITDIDTTNCSPLIVDSISNRILDGQNLRVQHISYAFLNLTIGERVIEEIEIIEKIGIEKEFIFYPICLPIDEFVYSGLRCYNDDSISYKNPWWASQFPGVDCDSLLTFTDSTSSIYTDSISNIQKVEERDFLIFPNPSDDFVTISNPSRSTDGYYVELYNSLGEKLNRMEYENTAQIDLRPYQAGMYLLKIYREASPVRTFKIIKD